MPGSDGTIISSVTRRGACANVAVESTVIEAIANVMREFILCSLRSPPRSARLAVIGGIGPHVGGGGAPVGHVVERRDRRDVPDVAVAEARLAQPRAVS